MISFRVIDDSDKIEQEDDKEYQPILSTTEVIVDDSDLPIQKIQLSKGIAKLKKTKSKQYKKKELCFTPIIYSNLEIQHQFIIYGFIEIESYYKDYNSMWDVNLVQVNNRLIKVNRIEKKMKESVLEVHVDTIGSSGLKDFQFLIDHFDRFSDIRYKELVMKLKTYQIKTQKGIEYLKKVNQKIQSRIISEEEVEKAFQDYDDYFQKYVRKNYAENDFIISGQVVYDFQNQDLVQKGYSISFAMLSLLGIEPENIEQVFGRQNIYFLDLEGMNRLKNAARNFLFSLNEKKNMTFYQTFYTFDHITFEAKTTTEFIHWPDAPEWMEDKCNFGIVQKLDLSLNQIQSIIDIRAGNKYENKERYYGVELDIDLEKQIQTEMFLEKFYPELYSDPLSKQSFKLKSPLINNQ